MPVRSSALRARRTCSEPTICGRDVFSRMIYGSRTILGVAMLAALVSCLVGIPLGLMSGLLRRLV